MNPQREKERDFVRETVHHTARLVSEPFVSVSFVPTHRRIKASSGERKKEAARVRVAFSLVCMEGSLTIAIAEAFYR